MVLHSWMSDATSFDLVKPYLDVDTYTYVFADLRGYGQSKHLEGKYNVEEIVADAYRLANHLKWKHFHIIGHSMSGMAVQRLAIDDWTSGHRRIKSVVAITPVTADGYPADEPTRKFLWDLIHDSVLSEQGVAGLTGQRLLPKWSKLQVKRHLATSRADAMRGYYRMWMDTDFSAFIIQQTEPGASGMPGEIVIGAPDDWYTHRRGLITKAEVRAVTLSKLRLADGQILWDLGAGSGSVAIEASTFIKAGRIYAVEKDAQRIRQIEMNRDRFGVRNLQIVQATLPDGLENLPEPDRIFIGGGGKRLGAIIRAAAARLTARGIMVSNTVLIKNLDVAVETLKQYDLNTELIQVQISRGREMPWDQRLEAQNPVWIVTGSKQHSNKMISVEQLLLNESVE